ncbi:DUF11 domain-containing protein [Echinicola soli]|uniref:DUF11 domain-containing protein n=1 Tax=Echinicola soli TaxID=2591634 RepID=A0A514CG85_9BACT|nr:gliding motility-associated C-terminal domain-containing protein [Echinicola soli]QDH78822.1 DUF11 domain-containing protein [Echinicola soli]
MKALLSSFLFWAACCFAHAAVGFGHESREEPIYPFGEEVHLLLEKTGHYEDSNEDGEFSAGDTIFYSFLIKNVCTGTIDQISVEDPQATVEGEPITLAPGEEDSTTFSAYYVLSQEDVDAGVFKNTATVSGKLPSGEVTTAKDEDIQDIYVKGSIKLEKIGTYIDTNGDGVPNVGDHVHYSFVVKNSCHVTLKNVHVLDTMVDVAGGPITLAPGEKDKTTFKATYVITQEDVDRGKVVNKATAEGENPQGELITDCDTYTVIVEGPDETVMFELTKAVDVTEAVLGQQLTYTISITNNSQVEIRDVTLTDHLPAVFTLVSSSLEQEADGGWIIESMEPDEQLAIEIIVMATQVGEAVNVVELTVGDYQIEAEAEAVIITDHNVDMAISKTSNAARIYQGDEFSYTITVQNNGEGTATGITIVDELPDLVGYVSSSYLLSSEGMEPLLEQEGNTLRWNIAEFPAGESMVITLTVKAKALGELLNEVSVESAHEDVNPADNTDKDYNTIAEFFIPNVFTPGTKDDINDYFVIRGLQQFSRNHIVIMNRLGDHVFEKENYQNDWDAQGLNGGAYFYVLKATDPQGDFHVFKGWVQVIKHTSSNQTER